MLPPRPPDPKDNAPADEDRNPIDALADSFLARLRRGEYPSISEYAAQHPQWAAEILEVFPTLAKLEKGGEYLGRQAATPTWKHTPQQIGEYRILCEIGRGGMGVVYEAEHRTMRRRVALKVLANGPDVDEIRLQRFYLEARVAGRLHHTNIVPVFEIGSDGHYHFYAMQFIRGQSLDVVFDELQRIRPMMSGDPGLDGATAASNREDLGKTVALGLASGQFEALEVEAIESSSRDCLTERQATESSAIERAISTSRDRVDPTSSTVNETVISQEDMRTSQPADERPTEPSYSISAELRDSTDRPDNYLRRVAKVGSQIAEALAYAHSHGILHRDIKPSNIILDTAGIAWVTDFGLAKDEDGDLTRSGDVLGTLRYMAPERFGGRADARSDVYGLGLTLYELCTLHGAFRASDRAQLVRDICHVELAKPRSVNPQIPQDLETIILKAVDKEPLARYQSARQMAEDLRLFLDDHPIRARRIGVGERIWRWARRNPQQAVLAACVMMLLCVVTVGALVFGYVTARQAQELAASQQIATQRLYRALRTSAEASRWSGRPGRNFTSINDVAHAAQVLPELGWEDSEIEAEVVELRNAAIAAMSLTDIRMVRSWKVDEPWTLQVTFNPTCSRYAQADRDGNISIRGVQDNVEYCRIPVPADGRAVVQMQFSPNDKYLAVAYREETGDALRVWDTSNATLLIEPDVKLGATAAFDFNTNSTWIALANGRSLAVYDVLDGAKIREVHLPEVTRDVCVGAEQGEIAVLLAGRRSIQVVNTDDWSTREIEFDTVIWGLAWHPRVNQMAVGGEDGSLSLVQLSDPLPPVRVFKGHTGRVHRLHFSPRGDLLASQAWDGTTRFWEVSSGEQLLRTESTRLLESSFSHPDGRFLGMNDLDHFHLWEVTRDIPMKVFRSPSGETRRWSVDVDLTGRWLASARDDGVEIWDIPQGKVVAFLPAVRREDGTSKDARFLPDGRALLTSNANGLRVYPMELSAESGTTEPRFLDPQTLHDPQTSWISLNVNGAIAAFRDHMHGSRGIVVNLPNPSERLLVGPHPGLDHVEISPDGRWIATTTWGGSGIHVWDAQTGSRITPQALEPSESKTNAVFSPDSKYLAASTPRHHAAWRVGTWETVFRVPRHVQDDWPGPLAYSPDGMLLAAAHSRFELALLNVRTGSEIAVVTAPGSAGFHDCCFSQDGGLLFAASDTNIHLWNLAQIRQQLAKVNLDF